MAAPANANVGFPDFFLTNINLDTFRQRINHDRSRALAYWRAILIQSTEYLMDWLQGQQRVDPDEWHAELLSADDPRTRPTRALLQLCDAKFVQALADIEEVNCFRTAILWLGHRETSITPRLSYMFSEVRAWWAIVWDVMHEAATWNPETASRLLAGTEQEVKGAPNPYPKCILVLDQLRSRLLAQQRWQNAEPRRDDEFPPDRQSIDNMHSSYVSIQDPRFMPFIW
jgi:hypothetical protein